MRRLTPLSTMFCWQLLVRDSSCWVGGGIICLMIVWTVLYISLVGVQWKVHQKKNSTENRGAPLKLGPVTVMWRRWSIQNMHKLRKIRVLLVYSFWTIMQNRGAFVFVFFLLNLELKNGFVRSFKIELGQIVTWQLISCTGKGNSSRQTSLASTLLYNRF